MGAMAPQIETIDHQARRCTIVTHRHGADDQIGQPAILGQSAAIMDKRDHGAALAINASSAVAAQPARIIGPRGAFALTVPAQPDFAGVARCLP